MEAAWDRVVESGFAEYSRRCAHLRSSGEHDAAWHRWIKASKSQFIAAWHHVSSMLDPDAIRKDYATFLTSPKRLTVRKTVEALGVDVGCLLSVMQSDEGMRTFRDAFTAIEGVLVACLGHYSPRPRALSVRLLNALYDGIDWQLVAAHEAVVAQVGDRFCIDVVVAAPMEELDGGGDGGPSLRVLVCAPSYDRSGAGVGHLVTMHIPHARSEDVWMAVEDVVPTSIAPYEGGGANAPAPSSASPYVRVTATRITLSLAPFNRCGYFDWRVVQVRADGVAVPLLAVSPLSPADVAAAAAAGLISLDAPVEVVASTPLAAAGAPTAASTVGDEINSASAVAAAASGAPGGLAPLTQGRFIVHRAGLREEAVHEVIVDLEGMKFSDSGDIVRHGTFGDVQEKLRGLRDGGVSSLFVLGAIERDNGWGEKELDPTDQAAVAAMEQGLVLPGSPKFYPGAPPGAGGLGAPGGGLGGGANARGGGGDLTNGGGAGFPVMTSLRPVALPLAAHMNGVRLPAGAAGGSPSSFGGGGGGLLFGGSTALSTVVGAAAAFGAGGHSRSGAGASGRALSLGGDSAPDSDFGFYALDGSSDTTTGGGGGGSGPGAAGSAVSPRGGGGGVLLTPLRATPIGSSTRGSEGGGAPLLPAGVRMFAARPDANPHAVVDRHTPNRMLGGTPGFSRLCSEARAQGLRIVVQLDAAVSASRPHRKYTGMYARTLDMKGQTVVHFGSDALENQWEDSHLLNYRKVEAWDLLVSEAKTLVQNFDVGGLYLTDAQSYPFIMALDAGELFRRDVDGEGHYSPREILEGEVVVPNTEAGYWTTRAARTYPNPLLIKLTRALWAIAPDFTVMGESHWGRAGALMRSGVIPHGVDVVAAMASTLGRFVDKNGTVTSFSLPASVLPVQFLRALVAGEQPGVIPAPAAPQFVSQYLHGGAGGGFPNPTAALLVASGGAMPRGGAALQLRSITSERLPYPALLLGRSAWTAVDLLYTLPGLPLTFGEEKAGKAYRVDVTGTYAYNPGYLEEERKKREKRLVAEKHAAKYRSTAAAGGASALGGSGGGGALPGGSVASSYHPHRSSGPPASARGSGGGSSGGGGSGSSAGLASRANSHLDLAQLSINVNTAGGGGGGGFGGGAFEQYGSSFFTEGDVGVGGVVPATPIRGAPSYKIARTGFSHINLATLAEEKAAGGGLGNSGIGETNASSSSSSGFGLLHAPAGGALGPGSAALREMMQAASAQYNARGMPGHHHTHSSSGAFGGGGNAGDQSSRRMTSVSSSPALQSMLLLALAEQEGTPREGGGHSAAQQGGGRGGVPATASGSNDPAAMGGGGSGGGGSVSSHSSSPGWEKGDAASAVAAAAAGGGGPLLLSDFEDEEDEEDGLAGGLMTMSGGGGGGEEDATASDGGITVMPGSGGAGSAGGGAVGTGNTARLGFGFHAAVGASPLPAGSSSSSSSVPPLGRGGNGTAARAGTSASGGGGATSLGFPRPSKLRSSWAPAPASVGGGGAHHASSGSSHFSAQRSPGGLLLVNGGGGGGSASSMGGGSEITRVTSWAAMDTMTFKGDDSGGGLFSSSQSTAAASASLRDSVRSMATMEARLRADVGPQYGFDLSQIGAHYEHRRSMRARYGVLRSGDLTVLAARHRFGEHGHVFSFGRSVPGVVAVVAANFNGHPSTFAVNCAPLVSAFGAATTSDASASVAQLMSASVAAGERAAQALAPAPPTATAAAATAPMSSLLPPSAPSLTVSTASSGTPPPSFNLKGGVWEVRDVFASGSQAAAAAAGGGAGYDGLAFNECDGPLIGIMTSEEAAYAPMLWTLPPHGSYCWLYVAAAASATGGSPKLGPVAGGMGSDTAGAGSGQTPPSLSSLADPRDAETDPAAMKWLFASSLLRLQSVLRLKECGLSTAVITRAEVAAAGGVAQLRANRRLGAGEPWISPGEALKDSEIQSAARHNLVYSLLRHVSKRAFKAMGGGGDAKDTSTPTAAAANLNGPGGRAIVGEVARLMEAALRILVTHWQLAEAPPPPQSDAEDEPTHLVGAPLPSLHASMNRGGGGGGGGATTPSAAAAVAAAHSAGDPGWYCIDGDVAISVVRSALFLAMKDVVQQVAQSGSSSGGGGGFHDTDVSDNDAALSFVLLRALLCVAQGQTGAGLAAKAAAAAGSGGYTATPLLARELTIVAFARRLLWTNSASPIVFVTPELGKWSTVGGLGVMVDELSIGLAELGADVVCVSPYYNVNRKGVSDYLRADGISYSGRNVGVWVGSERIEMGVHEGTVKGVRVFFLHNGEVFPRPYPPHDAYYQTRVLSAFGKGCLELLCQWRIIPSVIVTNDWFTALVPAYARHGHFGDAFNRTDFMHIAHNLDPDYEGRLWPGAGAGSLQHVHGLPAHLLVDPHWHDIVINPTRAALLCSDTWATVSRSYRDDLLSSSPLRSLLRLAPHPFAHPNGIPVRDRAARLASLTANTHAEAKAALQRKYFGFENGDMSLPLFAFVGRITLQKGVHLILQSVDEILRCYDGRVMFLVGGAASQSDTYGVGCSHVMRDLAARHRGRFWANPDLFFTDGDLVNLGADFCMMPSMFEPGGIVQQEFFVAGTPVIAFRTGGLKDTVFDFDPARPARGGNGFLFEAHHAGDFIAATKRAMAVYHDPPLYAQLRANARESVMDLAVVSRAWFFEFHRLRRCLPPAPRSAPRTQACAFAIRVGEVPGLTTTSSVSVTGSFSGWGRKYPCALGADGAFAVTLPLLPGRYQFKFVIDDARWVFAPSLPCVDDGTGGKNNLLVVHAPPLPEEAAVATSG